LWRIARLVKMTPEQTREQWLRGLSPMNQNNIHQERSIFKAELSKRDAIHKADMEKLESKLQQKSEIAKPIREPKAPPPSLQSDEDYGKYYLVKYLNELGIYSKEDLDSNYPIKPFQRPRPQQKDKSTRLEEKVDEIGNMLSCLNINNQSQKPVAKINRTQRYYPFQPINSSISANEKSNEGGYDEEKDIWYNSSEKKMDITNNI
ncbi:7860_t:CDS:2, partial [Diversispora eburnea]